MLILCSEYNHVWEKQIWLIPLCLSSHFARDEESPSKASHKKVTFNLSLDEDSEGENMEDIFGGKTQSSAKSESKSSFEKRQEKVSRLKFICQISIGCVLIAIIMSY